MNLARIYGYGYNPGTLNLPYSHNYIPNYDYPLPNWADPRWAPRSPTPTRTPTLSEATPVSRKRRRGTLWLVVGVLLVVLLGVGFA